MRAKIIMAVMLMAGICFCNSAFAEITYHVTNLNASGSGSFADCLSQANSDGQASRIVFDVSGTIHPGAVQNLTEGNCTICGSYVPPPGITFDFDNVSTGFNVTSGNNRFCNIRVINTKTNNDGISPHGAGSNIVVERCSFDFCRDEGVGMSNSYGNTIAFSRFENCGSQPGDGTGFANGRGILITGGSAVIVGCSIYHCNRGITLNTDGFVELRNSLLEASWSDMSGSGFTNAGGSHCYSNVTDCVANNNPFSGFMFRNSCKFYRSGNSGEGNGAAWNGQVPPEQWLEYAEPTTVEYSSPITGTDTPDYLPLPSWLSGAQTPSGTGSVGMGTGICQCYGGAGDNHLPAVDAGPNQLVALPAAANLDGTVTDDGLPNPPGAVTVTWTKQSGPGTVTFGNPNAVDTTASFSAMGIYALRLTASDGELWTYDEMTVTVGNNPPFVDAGQDQVITLPVVDANLNGEVTDDGLPIPPGAIATLWTMTSGPGTVTFGDAGAVDTTASFSEAGVYVLRLTADDGELQTYDELTISVIANNPPSVDAGMDQQITFPASANLDGTVSDDGNPNPPGQVTVTWTMQSGPGVVTFGNANAIDTAASFSVEGIYVLRLTADDSSTQTYDEVTITVNPGSAIFLSPDGKDGYVIESSETSGVGGTYKTTTTYVGDSASKQQYITVLHFDTSSIPDGATITSATISIRRLGVSGTPTSLGTLTVDIKNGYYGASDALRAEDFQAASSATNVATLPYPAANGNWSSGSLNSSGRSNINKTGVTQFKVRFTLDDDNDGTADYLNIYDSSDPPKLEVTWQ